MLQTDSILNPPAAEASRIKILILNCSKADAEAMHRAMRAANLLFISKRVEDWGSFVETLKTFKPDILLADGALPGFDGRKALDHVRRTCPEIPVVMVTDALGDEAATALLKAGAKDYVLKNNLVRLAPAIERVTALERAIRERKAAEKALGQSEERFRTLVEQEIAAIFILNENAVISYVNPWFHGLLGYSADNILKKPLLNFISDADKNHVIDAFASLISGKRQSVQIQTRIIRKDGTEIEVLAQGNIASYQGSPAVIGVAIDITERKHAEEDLQASRDVLATTERLAHIGGWEWDVARDRVTWSDELFRIFGRARETFAPTLSGFVTSIHPEDRNRVQAAVLSAMQKNESFEMEFRIIRPDKTERIVFTHGEPARGKDSKIIRIAGTAQDITDSKSIEHQLTFNAAILETEHELSPDAILVVDAQNHIISYNSRFVDMFDIPRSLVETRDDTPVLEYAVQKMANPEAFKARVKYLYANPDVKGFEQVSLKDGRTIDRYSASMRAHDGAYLGRVWFFRDISERIAAETRMRESEAQFRGLVEQQIAGIVIVGSDGAFVYANPWIAGLLGYAPADLIGRPLMEFVPEAEKASVREKLESQLSGKENFVQLTSTVRTRDNRTLEVLIHASRASFHGNPASVAVVIDISERRRAERTLERINRTLRTLSAGNEALVHASSEQELLDRMCHVLVDIGGYRMAAILYAENDLEHSVRPVASAGHTDGYFEAVPMRWSDTPLGQGPTGTAIRSGKPQVNQDFAKNPTAAPWHEAAGARGYRSSVALPLRDRGEIFGALAIYSRELDAFNDDEVKLLIELADDLSYGVSSLRDRKAREESAQRLRKSLHATVLAIASTLEQRDPYTAGHQRRVANLATAIGREMGVSEDALQGLYLAGVVHDIGKIQIPSELLSKPGKLTKLEYQLIQTHAQAGYDIVKGVDFPWPIAQMVLQHHERLDGSGYPNGLKGDAILQGAKILAVADVVEAMMSHRPYRESRGLEAALKEIENGRDRLYDPACADTCIALFRKKNYAFLDAEDAVSTQ